MESDRGEFLVRSRLEFTKATEGRLEMNLQQFISFTGCRSRFFAVATFDSIDVNKTGRIRFGDYIQFKKLLTFGSIEQKASFMFSLLDRDGDKWLTREDLEQGLKASSDENERPLKSEELTRLLDVLMRLFVTQPEESIGEERFKEVLQSYPDLLGSFQVGEGFNLSFEGFAKSTKKFAKKTIKKTKRWAVNHPVRLVTYIMTFLMISGAFFWLFWKFSGDCSDVDLDYADPDTGVTRREVQGIARTHFGIHISDQDAQYMTFSARMSSQDSLRCRDARSRKLHSWTLPIAKGCGRAMKVVFTLILFPVSRSITTKLRETFLQRLFDFDAAISYHKLLGTVGFLLAWVHAVSHFVHVYRLQNPSLLKEYIFAFPPDMENRTVALHNITENSSHLDGIPSELFNFDASSQPSALEALSGTDQLTGFALTAVFTIMALYALDYPKKLAFFKGKPGEDKLDQTWRRRTRLGIGKHLNNFNNFWYSHQLFTVFYLVFVLHPMPQNPLEEVGALTDAWVWILIPVLLYIADRIHRGLRWARKTPLIETSTLPGKVLTLKTEKPKDFEYKAGQYVMINCNKVSRFEWHPFTLTSAPQDPFLSVHIRAIGDWTTAMHDTLKGCNGAKALTTDVEAQSPPCPKTVKIAGPYGAPSQEYQDYKVVVCVGAGIGVTPFASILSSVLHSIRSSENRKTRKVYFHWVVRSRSEASWFTSLLDEIAIDDVQGVLDLTIHITSMKSASDLRLMLLRLAEFENTHSSGASRAVSSSIIRFGRPDWNQVLSRHKECHPELSRIGVFYCGPNALKRALKTQCEKLDEPGGLKFVFNKEIF